MRYQSIIKVVDVMIYCSFVFSGVIGEINSFVQEDEKMMADYLKTSMKPYMKVFQSFVTKLEKENAVVIKHEIKGISLLCL